MFWTITNPTHEVVDSLDCAGYRQVLQRVIDIDCTRV